MQKHVDDLRQHLRLICAEPGLNRSLRVAPPVWMPVPANAHDVCAPGYILPSKKEPEAVARASISQERLRAALPYCVRLAKDVFCLSAITGRRDRHDIAAEILEIAGVGLIRTHIMYKAKLSFGQLSEYIPMLLEKGLLEKLTVVKHRQSRHVLKTTEKGQKFLESLKSLELLWLP